ncbi:MAG: 4-hydroxy-tetrahydrodipicolinate synthase [Phycisphaerales bacterium]|nr:4-hydroxy-tetrahydrodipicolinate synthase [Phycisphaerales bacterium]
MTHFQGTITALITPFRNGQLDIAALERLVEHQIQSGVDGLVPCGTTGESPTLSKDEHKRVVETVVRTARKRVPIIAGAGSNNTAEAVRLAREAQELGADGLLVVSPYYNRPTQEGLRLHFSAIAREVPLPIMLYNIPGRCGVEITVETITRLRSEHANIVAVKHATGSVVGAADLVAACPSIDVLSGDDPITWPLMALGAIGVVSVLSNLAPRAIKALTSAALAGDAASALRAHRATFAVGQSLLSLETNPGPIKTAMAMRGWCAEEFRLPMCPLRPENRAKLESLLKQNQSALE